MVKKHHVNLNDRTLETEEEEEESSHAEKHRESENFHAKIVFFCSLNSFLLVAAVSDI